MQALNVFISQRNYLSFKVFNLCIFIYPMKYQIFDVIMVISARDRGHFSVSHPEGIWEHGFQLGVLSGTANITL